MRQKSLALTATAALAIAVPAHAQTTIDGIISPGEYSTAIVTNTPYNPSSDTTLHMFSNGSETVAETTYFQRDPNGQGFDFAVQTDPAGAGMDNADASVGDQFTNVYFGNPTAGAQVVFELGNKLAYNLSNGNSFSTAGLGILYADTQGTKYVDGGMASVSEAYIPYAAYDSVITGLGITPPVTGGTIQVRDLQAFGYGGNNAGGNRFGSITVPAPAAVPEPAMWAMMVSGFGLVGWTLRRSKRGAASSFA